MRFKLGAAEFTGETRDTALMVREFSPGGADVRTNDSERSQQDGTIPGVDLLGERLWAWEISARGKDLTAVLAANALLERAWRPPSRLLAGVTVPLSYLINGRWRRVYGRPGRYSGITPDYLAIGGLGRIVCDFRVTDPFYYDDAETSVALTIVPATTGGLEAPLAAPLSTVRSSAPRAGIVANAGDADTPLKVVFQGPVSNPWVRSSAGMEVGLTGTLAYDETVTVDPQAGTVTRQNGTPAAGLLTRKTSLASTRLKPGTTELTFGGTDPTGTAKTTLYWRNAYTSI